MKTVFFSNDRTEVEHLGKKLTELSIPCEVRGGPAAGAADLELELCIQRDEDLPRAFMECVRSGIGLAKRKTQPVEKDLPQFSSTLFAELITRSVS